MKLFFKKSMKLETNLENEAKRSFKKDSSFALKNEWDSQIDELKRQSIQSLEWMEPKHPIFSTELPTKIVKIVYETSKEIFKVVFDISSILETQLALTNQDAGQKPSIVKLSKNLQFVDEKLINNSYTIWFTIQGLLKIATKQSMQSIANYLFDQVNKFLLLDFELKQNVNFSKMSLPIFSPTNVKIEIGQRFTPLPKTIEETTPFVTPTTNTSGAKDVAMNQLETPQETNFIPNMTKRVSLGNSSQLFSQLLEKSSTEQLKNMLYMFTKDNAELLQSLEQKYGEEFME